VIFLAATLGKLLIRSLPIHMFLCHHAA